MNDQMFLYHMELSADLGLAVTGQEIDRLKALANWADSRPANPGSVVMDRTTARKAIEAAQKRLNPPPPIPIRDECGIVPPGWFTLENVR